MAEQKGPRRGVGKEQFWRRIVEGHRGSRQSVREWCDRHGVSEPSFYAWRRELAKRDAAAREPALMPVTITSSLPRAAAPLEIAWPGGVVVRVPCGCDVQVLRETLQVLRSLDERLDEEAERC